MSLKAWYPFNGNYNNQGVGALNLTQVTAPAYVTGGKVCNQTLSTGAFKWTADQTNSILNNKAISIAFWIKALNSNDGGPIFGTTGMAPPNNRRFTLYTYPKMNDFHWSWQNEDSSNAHNGGTITGCFPTGVWTHCCITYDGQTGTAIAYINGVEKSRTANKQIQNSTYAYETPVIHNNSNRHIQDFRVYDHCLTPREVRQLSQGLFLHYKLSDGITKNLISSLESGGRTSLSGTHSFNANFYENVDTYAWINVSPALELNKTYTLSFDVSNFPAGSKWTWQLWNSANYALIVDNNGHYSYTFKVEAAKLPSDYSLTRFLFDDGGRTGPANVVTFSNFKLEEGDTDTIWTPNANIDYLNYESDCGGYRLNGTRVGAVKNSLSTGRYKQSRKFDNNQYIYCSRTMTMTDATISAWLKIDTYPSSGYMLAFADQVSKIAFGFYNGNSAIISCGDSTNNSSVIVDLKSKWDLSKWHLVTITKKGSDYKFYFDGKLWTNLGSSNYWTMAATNMLCIGCRNNGSYADFYKGLMSDFRIYATALNETDVKILYDSALSFLENAVFQAYSVEDASVHNIKMTEQGILKSGSFSEIGYIAGMKIKTLPDGSAWARIHWLDRTRDKTLFVDDKEVAFCDKSNRFSLMGLVDHFKTPEGVYEFMLTYPSKSATAYNRWSQTSSPNAAYGAHTGLNIIHTDYTSHKNAITKSSSSGSATYSMNASGNWWAPIGQKADYSSGIPAANGETLMSTELWVRINNLNNITKISMLDDKYLQAFEIKEI